MRISYLSAYVCSSDLEQGYELHDNVFGLNGIMGGMDPLKDRPGDELCLVVQGIAPAAEMAEELTITATRQLFYARLPEVKGTAGGVSFVLDEVIDRKSTRLNSSH